MISGANEKGKPTFGLRPIEGKLVVAKAPIGPQLQPEYMTEVRFVMKGGQVIRDELSVH
jgi:hypothetical protein